MSDRFKFRFWDHFNQTMVYLEKFNEIKSCFFAEYEKSQDGGNNPSLMQSTGLRDKNGVLIYEGDIVKSWHDEYEVFRINHVSWIGGCFSLGRYWKDGTHDWYSMEQYESFEMEVIGNKYENPERLERIK